MGKNLTVKELKQIENDVLRVLGAATTDEYAKNILNHYDETAEETIMDSIINDVLVSSDWEKNGYYSYDDIRLAIGREIMNSIGIDY